MELLIRVRWRHRAPADLRLEVEPHHTVRDLLTAANEFCDGTWDESQPLFLERTRDNLALDAPVIDSGIVSGDTLRFELYGVDPIDRESLSEAVSCDVTAGPEAGRSFVLLPGRHEVGRAVGNAVRLHDVTVSDHQLSIIVYDDLVTRLVPDPSATNPVVVNGRVVSEAVGVGPNDVVQCGATAVALRVFSRSSDSGRDQLGQVPFRRTPYKPVVVQDREFRPLGNVPVKPEPRRFSMITTVLPIVGGLAMVAVFRNPMFLMMMVLSPISAVGQWWDGRRSGAQKFSSNVEDFRGRLERRKAEVDRALLDERAERINQSPDLADLARRATLRTLDLWSRQRGDDEFLRSRLGIGTVWSKITVEPEQSGEEQLREAVARTVAGFDRLPACPICVNLAELGVFALHGQVSEVRAMCSSMILQAATLHSPEDLVLVVLEGAPQGLGSWAKWLPHTRSATSPISAAHVVEDQQDAGDVVRELISIARLRTSIDDRADHRWPWILVALDESANVDAALASQLLDLCPAAGISVVAAVESDARVPRQAKATMRCVPQIGGTLALSTVWFTDPDVPPQHLELEPANARLIDHVAMSMAPLRDATASSATTAIPRVVPLLSLFGPELPTPLSVAERWVRPRRYGLRAPIGIGPSGALELDLVEHGPHALIGGTSGAGKSELLQSIVASLIHEYPPTRLTFLFVDYKGGAASVVFSDIPHTVGYVTNLEASLSLRALTSLRAELNHRMRLLEGKAKDLAEMLERFPDEAPPSLVIVVDEFATLVKEVPDFVAGVVDIAQRGRSLGVHLILATQRPSGSVNENILANTNLRISLRMLDSMESKTIIGVGSAADIPLPLKGRGFAKLGPRDLIEFQSAYTGAAVTQENEVIPVVVGRFGSMARAGGSTTSGWSRTSGNSGARSASWTSGNATSGGAPRYAPPMPGAAAGMITEALLDAHGALAPPVGLPLPPPQPSLQRPPPPHTLPPPAPGPAEPPVLDVPEVTAAAAPAHSATTHLDVLLDAVRRAMPNLPTPRKPWREMLPDVLAWSRVEAPEATLATGRRGRFATIGILDDPTAQAQYPAVFDLEEGGGLLVAGGGGSGKTTALRTIARSVIEAAAPGEVALFVIDCASRSLGPLRDLPHCAAVATGDDLESVTRVIVLLSAEVDRRRALLSHLDVQAETLSTYLDKGHSLPRIVVLVDGYQNLSAILGSVQPMAVGPLDWLAEFHRVVTDGRQLGIHVVLATDRRQAVPALMMSSIGLRLVLRQTDEQGYGDFGIPLAVSKGLDLPSGRGLWNGRLVQVGLVGEDPSASGQGAAIAEYAASLSGTLPPELTTAAPPDEVRVPLLASSPSRATVGRTDVFGDVVEIDVAFTGLCVVGPPRSGRTTALRQVVRSLVAAGNEVWTIGLGDEFGGPGRHAAAKADAAVGLLEDLAALTESLPQAKPYVLVIDNVDRYDSGELSGAFERIVKSDNYRLIGSTETRNLSGYTQNLVLSELRREPTLLVLNPESASDVMQYSGVRPQLRPGCKMSAGRGILVVDRQPVRIQVAVGS